MHSCSESDNYSIEVCCNPDFNKVTQVFICGDIIFVGEQEWFSSDCELLG